MNGNKNKKQIGIVTIFNVLNYGAVLQGLALYNTIGSLGYKPMMINYVPPKMRCKTSQQVYNKNIPFSTNIKNFIKRFLFGIGRRKGTEFQRFLICNEEQTVECNKIDDKFLNGEFEAIIVGSDQVWNPEYTDGIIDENFTLSHVVSTRKISFSSSLGSSVLSEENQSSLRNCLTSFHSISVREEYAKELLSKLGLTNVQKTCDPTFLLEKQQWCEMIHESDRMLCPNKKYMLIYTFDHDKRCFQVAKAVADKLNLSIISISSLISKPLYVRKQYSSLSPSGFLALFEQSSFIVTNSFHGTCFSLIFEKSFISINKTNNPTRVQNLLSDFGLLSRLCRNPMDVNMDDLLINYEPINKKRAIIRQEAITYLKTNLC